MTQPYGQGDFSPGPQPGYFNQPTPPPTPPSRMPQILAAIAAIVAVGAVAAVVALLLSSNSTDDNATTAAATTDVPAATATVVDQQLPEQATVTVTGQTGASTAGDRGNGPLSVNGANSRGFTSGPRCNAPEDPLLFVGYTHRSRAVVCQVGSQVGRNYYRGYADGNTIEVGYPTRAGSTFTAVNGDIAYIVSPSSLVITRGGATIATEPMIQAWIN
ncbi:MAG: hypothetical protein WAW85_05555 [Gordonia sp. (in: high G+C Gram-positive bacteria)]|uniref:hypothetical protein n=1 Tax=Gordonia sp. (in: high G+C Gram-positive bacteria) TaxID=84139 RepID=UPI003BB7F78C